MKLQQEPGSRHRARDARGRFAKRDAEHEPVARYEPWMFEDPAPRPHSRGPGRRGTAPTRPRLRGLRGEVWTLGAAASGAAGLGWLIAMLGH